MGDVQILNDKEFKEAMADLKEKGLIEFNEANKDEFNLTNAGIDYAFDLLLEHTPTERAAMMILAENIHKNSEEEAKVDN